MGICIVMRIVRKTTNIADSLESHKLQNEIELMYENMLVYL